MRQPLPAELLGCGQQTPAGVRIGFIGLLETLGRRHRTVVVTRAAFEVARLVDREQYFFAEFSRLGQHRLDHRSEEHTSELQSLMRISYAVFCLKKNNTFSTTLIPLHN